LRFIGTAIPDGAHQNVDEMKGSKTADRDAKHEVGHVLARLAATTGREARALDDHHVAN
jgi:hypothetical protein